MKNTSMRRAIVPGFAALALGLTACGSNAASSDLAGEISGAGSSAQGAAQQAWIAGFSEVAPDVNVAYDPIGSGGGRENFTTGGTNYGGSDAYLDDEEIEAAKETCGGGFVEFPAYISPIAIAFNVPGVDSLNLSPAVIAQIFDNKIKKWNDPAIAADNEGVELPDSNITTVHRSDESGTTENFSDYLAKAAPKHWSYEVTGDWPAEGGVAAAQTQGVAQALKSTEGTIGYIDASQVGDLGAVAVGVGDEFVEFTPEAAAAAVDAATPVEGRPDHSYAIDLPRDTDQAGVYPVVLVSYQMACANYEDAATADLVKEFFSYIISEDGQAKAAEFAGSAPISEEFRVNAQASIDAITGGEG